MKGLIKLDFSDSESIEFEYPTLKIEGIYKNRRSLQWEGSFNFRDAKNSIYSVITFSKGPSFTNSNALPLDCFEGSIVKNNQKVCKVQGSWLEFLRFNNSTIWELETCEMIKPTGVNYALPSDSKYRSDLAAFKAGDIVTAQ